MRSARIARIYCPNPLSVDAVTTLDKRSSHHVQNVLRARINDSVELFNGDGYRYFAQVAELGKCIQLLITDSAINHSESPVHITLVQSISRGDRMDTTVQKAVELGVSAIKPVYTRQSIARLDDKRETRKVEHWRQIAVGASEQCGRSLVPQICRPQVLIDYLKTLSASDSIETRLALIPEAPTPLLEFGLTTVDASAEPAEDQTPMPIVLLVGPESGFDDDEIASAVQAGYKTVRCGPRILRTETAGAAALAILQAWHGDLSH